MATESDTAKARKISEEYQNEAFPVKYRDLVCEKMPDKEEIVLTIIDDILLSDTKKGGKMLDFGCGPTIHRIASASRYYKEIILADYSDYNRRAVEKWLKEDDQRLDWKPVLEVVAKLEGYNNVCRGTKEIEKRIRSSVKKVIPCDILSDPPIPEEYGKFDLVLTSYCLESVCATKEMFKKCVKKVCDLIEVGGSLILIAVLNAGPYVAHKDLYILPVDEILVKTSLEECGMKISFSRFVENNEKHDYCEYSGIIIVSADKK